MLRTNYILPCSKQPAWSLPLVKHTPSPWSSTRGHRRFVSHADISVCQLPHKSGHATIQFATRNLVSHRASLDINADGVCLPSVATALKWVVSSWALAGINASVSRAKKMSSVP